MNSLLLNNLQKESLSHQLEAFYLKILLTFTVYIMASILVFYTFQKLKKLLFYGKKKKRVNPYAQFNNPKSMLGMCISYSINDMFGRLEYGKEVPKIKREVDAVDIKSKLTYLMKNKMLNRKSIITLVTYLENYAPKKDNSYENDIHYIQSTLKHHKLSNNVLRCFDELLDELASGNIIKISKNEAKNTNVIDLQDYRYRKAK